MAATKKETSTSGSGGDDMKELEKNIKNLIDVEFVNNRKMFEESWTNFDKIAPYCEDNFQLVHPKSEATRKTKDYASRALESVISQINRCAHNLQLLFDYQLDYLDHLTTQTFEVNQRIDIIQEQSSRHRIGKIVTRKQKQPGVPLKFNPPNLDQVLAKKRKINYYGFNKYSPKIAVSIRQGIDFDILDNIGSGQRIKNGALTNGNGNSKDLMNTSMLGLTSGSSSKTSTLRPSKSTNLSSLYRQSADMTHHFHGHGTLKKPEAPPVVKNPPTLIIPEAALQRTASSAQESKDSAQNSAQNAPNPSQNPQNVPAQSVPNPQQPSKSNNNNKPSVINSTNPFARDVSEIVVLQKVIALYDYEAEKDDELSFKENEIIDVTAKNDDGWWEGVSATGVTGLFPGNYVTDYNRN